MCLHTCTWRESLDTVPTEHTFKTPYNSSLGYCAIVLHFRGWKKLCTSQPKVPSWLHPLPPFLGKKHHFGTELSGSSSKYYGRRNRVPLDPGVCECVCMVVVVCWGLSYSETLSWANQKQNRNEPPSEMLVQSSTPWGRKKQDELGF